MVKEDKLSSVLGEFARTMVTDFPIQGILDHLVERIVEVLPIDAAGVTLISPGRAPRYIAASNAAALRFEQLQTESGEGPCLLAFTSGKSVSVPDVSKDTHFPTFGPAAADAGLVAVFTFPLRPGDSSLGALDLYCDTPGSLAPHDMDAAQTLADVTAAYLVNAQGREDAQVTSDHFHHSALHDALTGLPNRMLLQQRLEHAAMRARRSNTPAAILFADLDKFKQVNDEHGHHIGDELLIAVAERLSGLVRPGDTLARVSGDEFVFLCEDLHETADVEVLAKRIEEAFRSPFVLSAIELTVTASVGMAFAGPGEAVSNEHVVQADIAMYQAKRAGNGEHRGIFDAREALDAADDSTLQVDLRCAFDNNELEIAYQPIVDGADGLVTGVEALVRWNHPERGEVRARSIIGMAERSGLAAEIGTWMLEMTCIDRRRWLDAAPASPLEISVNVSPNQLLTHGFCKTVERVLTGTGMDPASLVLDLTEAAFINDGERALTVLQDLQRLGVRMALDNFGTGYSSLSSLRNLPLECVKIDGSFISEIGCASTGMSIMEAVTNLAHVLGMTVTAEGVETQAQCNAVRQMGCDSAQGYFYARPMSASVVAALLCSSTGDGFYLPQALAQ